MEGFAPHTLHRRLRLKAPDAFGLNPLANWLSGITDYRFKIRFVKFQFTTNVEYKIDYISKTKNNEQSVFPSKRDK